MATLKRDAKGKLMVEAAAAGTAAEAGLVRAMSLNDKRENAYTATVHLKDSSSTLFIFEHKRAAIKDFKAQLRDLADRGVALQKRPMPELAEEAAPAQVEEFEAAVAAEIKLRETEAETLQTDFDAITLEVNSCIRGWDLADENGETSRRCVNYAAELEAENIGPSMAALIFQRVWEKHTLGTDERQR